MTILSINDLEFEKVISKEDASKIMGGMINHRDESPDPIPPVEFPVAPGSFYPGDNSTWRW